MGRYLRRHSACAKSPPKARDFLEEESDWWCGDGNCANKTKRTVEEQQQQIIIKKKGSRGFAVDSAPAGRIPDGRTNDPAPPSAGKEGETGKKKKAYRRQLHRKSVVLCIRLEWVDKKRPTKKEPRVGRLCLPPPFLRKVSVCVDPLAAWNANSSVEQPARKYGHGPPPAGLGRLKPCFSTLIVRAHIAWRLICKLHGVQLLPTGTAAGVVHKLCRYIHQRLDRFMMF